MYHQERGLDEHLVLGGASFIYKLYKVGDRMEPCGTLACIPLNADISPSTETLNFQFERNKIN
jgi:hypothetical protein